MNSNLVVVDANVVFRALAAGGGDLRETLDPGSRREFFSPRFLFVELFKHKERISLAAHLDEDELLAGLYTLVSRLEFVNEADIPIGLWTEAVRLCRVVDEKDAPYVALTLHLDGLLWTFDQELKRGLLAKGFDRFFIPRT